MKASSWTVFAVTVCVFLTAGGYHAANASQRYEALPSGVVTFADASGTAQGAPLIDIRGAYPGMPAQEHSLGIVNTGDVPAAWDLAVHTHTPAPTASLVDVLMVTLRPADGGGATYHGTLADLRVSGDGLAPGGLTRYIIEVSWPDGGAADNAYQGASLDFDLTLRSRAA